MEKWILKGNSQDFSDMANGFGISEDLARLIVYRGHDTKEKVEKYLYMDISQMYSPLLLKDMDKAVDIISQKIRQHKRIRIVGDYDVDGIMSTYILYTALKKLGGEADYVIPDRIKDGYGINIDIIDDAYKDGVDTILTCDNGIAAIDQISHAKELGMTVVVTDHHDIVFKENENEKEYILPCADAVVNPHRPGDKYPFPNICGAVVAYKLAKQLYDEFMVEASEEKKFIEFACMATICDIMPLVDENRVIVREGLKMIEKTKNIGLASLIEATGMRKKENSHIDVYHIGFIIGPCFNASGRLKTADIALKLLCCNDQDEADILAQNLVDLNNERKEMTEKNTMKIFEKIENSSLMDDKVIVVYEPDCHESLAGIIAGRIKERYYRPAFVITDGDNLCKGSGRSIEGYNMFEALVQCDECLLKYGGHPMAAGISLDKKMIDGFRRKLNEKCTLKEEDMVKKTLIDIVKNPNQVTENMIMELAILEPCGTGNEKPVFAARNIRIKKGYKLGKVRQILKFDIECKDNQKDDFYVSGYSQAVYFGNIEEFENRIMETFGEQELKKIYEGRDSSVCLNILYSPTINEFNGRRSVQIVIKGYSC